MKIKFINLFHLDNQFDFLDYFQQYCIYNDPVMDLIAKDFYHVY